MDEKDIKERWKEYMEKLLNVENEWNTKNLSKRRPIPSSLCIAEDSSNRIGEREVREATNKSKIGKASSTTEVVIEKIRAAGEPWLSV